MTLAVIASHYAPTVVDPLQLTDASGNGRHGAWTNTPTAFAGGSMVNGDSSAVVAMPNDASVPSAAWMNQASITVLCTAKVTSLTGNTQVIAARWTGTVSTSSWTLRCSGTSGLYLDAVVCNGSSFVNSIGGSLVDNTVYDLAFTFDAGTGTVRTFINGSQVVSASIAAMNTSSTPLTIGKRTGGQQFLGGAIDDLAIFSTALSGSTLSSLSTQRMSGSGYAATILGMSPLAYYRMSDL